MKSIILESVKVLKYHLILLYSSIKVAHVQKQEGLSPLPFTCPVFLLWPSGCYSVEMLIGMQSRPWHLRPWSWEWKVINCGGRPSRAALQKAHQLTHRHLRGKQWWLDGLDGVWGGKGSCHLISKGRGSNPLTTTNRQVRVT